MTSATLRLCLVVTLRHAEEREREAAERHAADAMSELQAYRAW
jgi:hypothetical protein